MFYNYLYYQIGDIFLEYNVPGCCVSDNKVHRNYVCKEIIDDGDCLQECLKDIGCKGWAMIGVGKILLESKLCVIFTSTKTTNPRYNCTLDGLKTFLGYTANQNTEELNPRARCGMDWRFQTGCYVKGI